MPTEQEVIVKIEDGGEYPAVLFGGRLDVDALEKHLARDGLMLTQLNGKVPNCDRNGLSRTMFTAANIQAQTTRHPGEASSPPFWTCTSTCLAMLSNLSSAALLHCGVTA